MTNRQHSATTIEHAPDAAARWVLVASVLASSMVFIDGTALMVAFAALQADLRADGTDLLWINNAYALILASLLLLGGSLGDRFGKRRIFTLGIAIFSIASVCCGVSPNAQVLTIARVIQGVGGALMIPGSLALVAVSFGPGRRGKAIGTWSACTVIATALGPVIGGLLAEAGLWRGIFFINLPLAAAALAITFLKTPPEPDQRSQARLDYHGAALATLGLTALNYGLIEAPTTGLGDWRIAGSLLASAVLIILFVARQQRSPEPLLPLDLFRRGALRTACLLTLLNYAAFYWMQFFLPLNLIQVQGYSATAAGLALLPVVVLLAAFSRWAGVLVDRHGPRWPIAIGSLLAGLGCAVFAASGLTAGPADFASSYLPALLLLGLGMAFTVTPLTTTIVGSVASSKSGLASGINGTLARLAGVLAIALFGPIALASFGGSLELRVSTLDLSAATRTELLSQAVRLVETPVPHGLDAPAAAAVEQAVKLAFVDTFSLLSWIAASLCLVGAVVGAAHTRAWGGGEKGLAVATREQRAPWRWWTYQRERFPLLAHGLLIAVFSSSAVCYSFLLRGVGGSPSFTAFLAAFITSLLFFLQLRIADEFKDFADDARFRPHRPVPRGLVTLRELGVVFVAAACIQAGLVLWIAPTMLLFLIGVWAYLALMTKEFFVSHWIKSHAVTYLWTHMLIIPSIAFFASAWDWWMVGTAAPGGLPWFLAASFCNGIVLELGRKIRAPSDEREGVETYTALWGPRNAALAWQAALLLAAFCAWRAARAIQFAAPMVGLVAVIACAAAVSIWLFVGRPTTRRARRLEHLSALWTLGVYMNLGIVALAATRFWTD